MRLTDPAQLVLRDELDERLRRAIRHLQELNTDEMRAEFTRPDDFWHWGADYMGRWIGAMAWLGRHTGEDYGAAAVAREMIGHQRGDGSFGSYTDPHDFQEWFGMSRGLVGLLECYSVHPDPALLEAAGRLGDYYARMYPEIAPVMYECYSTAIEGLVLLAQLTGEARHRETARRVADASMVFQHVWFSAEVATNGRRTPCAGQMHCQLSTARGLLDLYEFTGDERYLKPVLALHEHLTRELLWISGGLGFYFFRPEENETCADADWFRLNLQLWRLTRQPRYMDLAERVLVNQLYFMQADNGGFCYLRGLQNRAGAVFDACCSHHGPRALCEAIRYAYTTEPRGVWVNLFFEGSARLSLGEDELAIESRVREEGDALALELELREPPSHPLALHVRIPEWAGQARLAVNGRAMPDAVAPGYSTVERAWADGDRLEVRFPLEVRVVRGQRLGRHVLHADEAAVYYGPRLFCVSDALNPTVLLHLVRVRLPANGAPAIRRLSPDRLEADGLTPDGGGVPLILSPLAGVGGVPSGAGRIHTVRSPYYKTWIPFVDGESPT